MPSKNDVWVRSLTGSIFLIIMIGGILYSWRSTHILFSSIVLIASWEYARMQSIPVPGVYALLSWTSFIAMGTSWMSHIVDPWVGLVLLGGLTSIYPFLLERSLKTTALAALGVVLLPLSFSLLCSELIAGEERLGILFFFLILWTNDTMAYVNGRLFGRHKMWVRISPKKTWEGFFGGLLFATGLAFFIANSFDYTPIQGVIAGVSISIFGTLGDFLESAFKRIAGIKDSGNILPGHGGMLDRVDGVTLAAPMMWTALYFFTNQ